MDHLRSLELFGH